MQPSPTVKFISLAVMLLATSVSQSRMVQNHLYHSPQLRPNQNSKIAVALAISGGGHRAANFGAGVLMGLEDVDGINLLKEIDYFSTVSGGGVPAGIYIKTLQESQTNKTKFEFKQEVNELVKKALRWSYDLDMWKGFFDTRMFGLLNKGDILENQFDKYIMGGPAKRALGILPLKLSDLFVSKKRQANQVTLPWLVCNSSVYTNLSSFPVTPDLLDVYEINGYVHQLERRILNNAGDLPLSVAMKASASFPFAVPATTFIRRNRNDNTEDYVHLVDGGLVDNFGWRTALELLKNETEQVDKKFLIVVDANQGWRNPCSGSSEPKVSGASAYRNTKYAPFAMFVGFKGMFKSKLIQRRNCLREDVLAACKGTGVIPIFLEYNPLSQQEKVDQMLAEYQAKKKAMDYWEAWRARRRIKLQYRKTRIAPRMFTKIYIGEKLQMKWLDAGKATVLRAGTKKKLKMLM